MLELQCLERPEQNRKSPITAVRKPILLNQCTKFWTRKRTTVDLWRTEDEFVGTNAVK